MKLWDADVASGSVMMKSVFLMSGDVMEVQTVWMDLMKWIALVDILLLQNISFFESEMVGTIFNRADCRAIRNYFRIVSIHT